MNRNFTKVVLILLAVVMAVLVFVACDNNTAFSVKVYDGDSEIATLTAGTDGSLDFSGKVTKAGYTLEGLYYDKEFSREFTKDSVVTGALTLYAKFEKTKANYTITVNTDGGDAIAPVGVTFGETYTLTTPTKEGYEFLYYTFRDDNGEDKEFPLTDIYNYEHNVAVKAVWKTAFTVTLNDTLSEDPTVLTVAYGAKAVFPADPVKTGYTFDGWFEAEATVAFDKNTVIKTDYTLTAKYHANSYTITMVNYPAWSQTVVFGENYTLPTEDEITAAITGADKEWSEFLRYECAETGFDATKTSDVYKWDHNIVVTAVCSENESYHNRTVTLVRENDSASLGTITVEKGATVEAELAEINTDRDGYDFVGWFTQGATTEFNALTPINNALTLYARYTAKVFKIILDYGEDDMEEIEVAYKSSYALPTLPMKAGYKFLGYIYNDEAFDATGTFTWLENITVGIEWEQETDIFVDAGTYFKERTNVTEEYTYVFLTGRTYSFGEATIATEDGYEYISLRSVKATNDSFAANRATDGDATFSLTVTPAHGVERTIKARVVESVNTFGIGADFNAMIANVSEDKGLFQVSTTAADYVMDIGKDNFIPDINVKNLNGDVITLSAANVEVTVDGTDVTTSLDGNALSLAADFIGDTVKTVTFAPKYALATDHIARVSFKVKVNDGVNVYTNAELKAEYAKSEVQCVNILRNIKAELDYADYVDGTYGRRGDIVLDGGDHVLKDWDLGTPLNQYSRGVYRRTTNNQADNIVINGNYFTIDGSKLPYVSDPSSRTDQEGPYKLMEVQIGIFMYRCVEIDYTNNKRDINVRYAGGNASINNLMIEGNSQKSLASSTESIANSDKALLKMSAAFIGIVVRGGTLNLNNTTISDTTTGIMLDGGVSGYGSGIYTPGSEKNWVYDPSETQSVHLNMNKSIITGAWANDIYSYNLCALTLKDSKLDFCNGAALHFDDLAYANPTNDSYEGTNGYSNLNSMLVMDAATSEGIQNWVTGAEAWFVAYGKTDAAALIKGMMDGLVRAGTENAGAKSTILSPDGSMMNFAILVNSAGGTWNADKDGHVKLDTPNIVDTGANVIFFYGDESEQAAVGGTLLQSGLAPAMEQGQAIFSGYVGQVEVQPGIYVNINMHLYLPIYRVASAE